MIEWEEWMLEVEMKDETEDLDPLLMLPKDYDSCPSDFVHQEYFCFDFESKS